MDVANRLARWKDHPPEKWLKTANRVLPPIVTGILVLLIAYQLAGLTWRVMPGAQFSAPAPEVAQPGGGSVDAGSRPDYARLSAGHLFGAAPEVTSEPVVQEVVDAPDTTLNLELTGIVAREATEVGQAIITSGNESRAYSVGDTIENASGARLHSVYGDRVLLNRSGRLETLRLPKDLPQRPAAATARMAAPAASNDGGGSLREVISDNASRITDIMRLAPHIEAGEMVGFRLNPGRDRDTFTSLGLEAGDVVTDINGMVLTDPSAGLQVFQALGESTMANVTVLRNGVPQVIVIDTTQLQNLAENRE
jgi:general secretion pathway protein C